MFKSSPVQEPAEATTRSVAVKCESAPVNIASHQDPGSDLSSAHEPLDRTTFCGTTSPTGEPEGEKEGAATRPNVRCQREFGDRRARAVTASIRWWRLVERSVGP